MDDRRFDSLTRALASGQNRRSVLKGLLGLGGVTLAGSVTAPAAGAARRPTPTPKPVSCPGQQHWNGSACVCPDGNTKCGPDCCPHGQAECCDNACCYGECYGEELCCPTGQLVCNGSCCAAGDDCIGGACQSCVPCGDQCCSAPNSQCCQSDEGSYCVAAGSTCCDSDSNCSSLTYCDGIVLHEFTCSQGVCVDNPQSCAGDDPCVTYECDSGRLMCVASTTLDCCRNNEECDAVDSCTPGVCSDTHTCNTVSSCTAQGGICCDGTCTSGAGCCTTDSECAQYDHCEGTYIMGYLCSDGGCVAHATACNPEGVCVKGTCDPTTLGCVFDYSGCLG